MRAAIIVNLVSGVKERVADVAAARTAMARDAAAACGVEAAVVCTTHRGHGAALAASFVASGCDRIVAWGGDGTVNEVAGPLIGTEVTLGVVPTGSGNGLAGSLRLHRDPRAALRVALGGVRAKLDAGRLAGRHFLNVAGIGFDAALARTFDTDLRRGTARYVRHGCSLAWSYRSESYSVELDGRELSGRWLLIAFANGREYGSRCVIAPDADPRDGLLDVVIVDAGHPLRSLWRARRLIVASSRRAQGIRRARVSRAVVAGSRLLCHVDGEPFDVEGHADATVLPAALWMAC